MSQPVGLNAIQLRVLRAIAELLDSGGPDAVTLRALHGLVIDDVPQPNRLYRFRDELLTAGMIQLSPTTPHRILGLTESGRQALSAARATVA